MPVRWQQENGCKPARLELEAAYVRGGRRRLCVILVAAVEVIRLLQIELCPRSGLSITAEPRARTCSPGENYLENALRLCASHVTSGMKRPKIANLND